MNTPTVLYNCKDIDVSKLAVSTDVSSKSKFARYFDITYDGHKKFAIALPDMVTVFGANKSEMSTGDAYYLELSFDGMTGDSKHAKKLKVAHDKLAEMDQRLRELIYENRKVFLSGMDGLEDLELRDMKKILELGLVRPAKDKKGNKYAPKVSLSMPTTIISNEKKALMSEAELKAKNRLFQTMDDSPYVVDAQTKVPLDINVDNLKTIIPAGCVVRPLIQLNSFNVTAKFQVNWKPRLLQAMIMKQSSVNKQSLMDMEYSDDDENEQVSDVADEEASSDEESTDMSASEDEAEA